MNKLFFKYIPVLLLLIVCSFLGARAQTISVDAKLQQYTIRIGDQTKFFLSVHQPVNAHVNFPKLTDTLTGKVQIVSINKSDTVIDKNNRSEESITQSYTITCFDEGTYNIPPLAFGTTGGVLKTNEVMLQVQTVKVDTTKGIYDIKQPLKVSYTFFDSLRDNWYWPVTALLIIGAAVALYFHLKNRPKKTLPVRVTTPAIPAHIAALAKLNELKEKALWQKGETKLYYIELSDVLREYLENRFIIKTHEKTTDEIFDALSRIELKDADRDMLRQVLTLADLVKFAKEKPAPFENEQSLANAISFVKNTQQETAATREGGNDGV